jgi:hypothetical protein
MDMMNLLDISHFGCGKNVGLCVKQLLAKVHGGILLIDRLVPINMNLIDKIIGFPTNREQQEDYLDNKNIDKEILEDVKAQFRTNKGTRGLIIKDINDQGTIFSTKLMAFKLLIK